MKSYYLTFLFLVLVICSFVCPIVMAEEEISSQDVSAVENAAQAQPRYWVVGDYPEKRQAITEGERLSGVTGVEVLMLPIEVGGKTNFQLLVRLFTDEYDQARLKDQLGYAGVTDIRDTSIAGNEPGLTSLFAVLDYSGEVLGSTAELDFTTAGDPPVKLPTGTSADAIDKNPDPDAVTAFLNSEANTEANSKAKATWKQNFLVVGSFHESSHAELLRLKLAESFAQVLVMVGRVNGADVHRVLVGPVDASAEEEFRARASIKGIENTWIMPGVVVDSLSIAVPAQTERSDFTKSAGEPDGSSSRPRDKATGEAKMTPARKDDPDADSDAFNLAKMRKKAGSLFFSPDK